LFVNRADAKLGRKLPLGYIAAMCRDNGGEVTTGTDHWWLYPIFDDSDRKRLKRTCNDIVRETASAREWPHFPPQALAIGHNSGGDQLVLLADPETDRYADAVYWWDHETGDTTLISSALRHMVSTRENAAAFRQRVGVMVDGFDDDPRGLWQFPKVRQFFRRLFAECPFVMSVAHPDGGLLKLLAAWWLYEDELTEEVELRRMTEFLDRAFHGLNGLNQTLALSEEQNREICVTAATVLFGETPPL
jgi:SMI1 / KNR4 family (SUKH-1)